MNSRKKLELVRNDVYRRRHEVYPVPMSLPLRELPGLLHAARVTQGKNIFLYIAPGWDLTQVDIVEAILDAIGSQGTLAMWAPLAKVDSATRCDFQSELTSGGAAASWLLRQTEARRSVHVSDSVCAIGPNAEYLTRDHHLTETAWGECSPFFRCQELGGRVLCIGSHPWRGMFPLLCVESLLRHEIPQIGERFTRSVTYNWRSKSGEQGRHTYFERTGPSLCRVEPSLRYYQECHIHHTKAGPWEVLAVDARQMVNFGINLARRGVGPFGAHNLWSKLVEGAA